MTWRGTNFVPSGTAIKFLSFRQICLTASAMLIIASIALFFSKGLNYGIDFLGGVKIEIGTKDGKPVDRDDLRSKLGTLNIGDPLIQQIGKPQNVLIRIQQQSGGEEAQQKVVDSVRAALGETYEYRNTQVIGPTVSAELAEKGIIAVVAAIFCVLLYIWFRFEWQFSLGAVAALVHDVILTIGIFSLLELEFGLSIIAALLTIVGYSLNDTVVVYDRVRENLRRFKKMALPDLLDLSINETLSRTILTSVTTLIALVSLYVLGGEVLRGFVFAMIWGVIVGTYSSVFIASPVLLLFGVKRDWSGLDANKNRTPAGAQV
ncbi:MAG: protein translocase subunit SecF [Methyloligellaceae bacterium]